MPQIQERRFLGATTPGSLSPWPRALLGWFGLTQENSLVLLLALLSKHMKMSKVKGIKKSNIIINLGSLFLMILS